MNDTWKEDRLESKIKELQQENDAVEDKRTLSLADGSREAAFGVSMGYVEFNPTASEIVQDIFVAELTSAGHKIVNQEQQVIINAQILQFKVGTIATPIYWDIIGNTSN